MLAAEALRLAAVEALCPTEAIAGAVSFPTMAGHRVYDSATLGIEDLDAGSPFTPCLSVHTDESRSDRRGDAAPSSIGHANATLVIVADLAVSAPNEQGQAEVGIATEDAKARLVLGALCAQVRKTLVFAPAGSVFRSIGYVEDMRIEPFALPQFDLRWMRNTIRLTCKIHDDKFTDAAGLPEPLKSLAAKLPAGSYAKAKLVELEAAFAATVRAPIDGIVFSTTGSPQTTPEGSVS